MFSRHNVALAGVAGFLATVPLPASAQGIPVIDTASIAEQIRQAATQLEELQAALQQIQELQRQYTELIAQGQTLISQLESITGARDIGEVLNSVADIGERYGPEELGGVLDAVRSGAEIAGEAGKIQARIEDIKSIYDVDGLIALTDSVLAAERAIEAQGSSAIVAMAVAEEANDRANRGTERVSQIIDMIDAQPDIKASMDLNTRMQAEVAVLLADLIRLQSAGVNADAAETMTDARDRAAAAARRIKTRDGAPEE